MFDALKILNIAPIKCHDDIVERPSKEVVNCPQCQESEIIVTC